MLLCLGSGTILMVPLAFRDLIDFGFGQRAGTSGGLLNTLSLNGHFALLFGLASLWALAVSARLLHRELGGRAGHGEFAQRGV